MQYWLMKSEPDEFSIDDLLAAPGAKVAWFGVRNYQARNFMRDQMKLGDGVLYYHSSCAVPGIAGIAEVASKPYPDESQFDPESKYYDPKSTRENPRWVHVDVKGLYKVDTLTLTEMRTMPEIATMTVLSRGNRLSIPPVETAHWDFLKRKLKK